MEKSKKITIKEYLNEYSKNKLLNSLLENYALKNIDIELFFKVFDSVQRTPSDLAKFILDDKNGYDLSVFGNRTSGNSKYYGYNGKSMYQGTKCTLGASHSKFHG